jgi:hypothetical protein
MPSKVGIDPLIPAATKVGSAVHETDNPGHGRLDPRLGRLGGADPSLHGLGIETIVTGDEGLEGQGRKPSTPVYEPSNPDPGVSIPTWVAIKSREGDDDLRSS